MAVHLTIGCLQTITRVWVLAYLPLDLKQSFSVESGIRTKNRLRGALETT
jgi:hypothetical protein